MKPATSGLSIQREAPSKTARINYPDLDLMKLAMAFFVVEIHTRPLRDVFILETIVEGLDVLAVPFFFIASAFLCFKGLSVGDFVVSGSKGSVRVRKTMGKLLQLYITWTVVFLPVTVFGAALQGTGVLDGFVSFARGALLIGENFCSWPLWYLLASVVAFALVYLLLRGGSLQGTFWSPHQRCFFRATCCRSCLPGTKRLRSSLSPLKHISPCSARRATGCSRGSSMSP